MSKHDFEAAYQLITPRLQRYAELLAATHNEAKDLFQQTSLRVFTSHQRFDPEKASLITWSAQIMRREHQRPFREGRSSPDKISRFSVPIGESQYQTADTTSNTVERDLDVVYWYQQLTNLATPWFLQVGLQLASGHTFAEIGEQLGQEAEQLKLQYQSERTKIRRKLGLFHCPKQGIRNHNKIITRNHLLPD